MLLLDEQEQYTERKILTLFLYQANKNNNSVLHTRRIYATADSEPCFKAATFTLRRIRRNENH